MNSQKSWFVVDIFMAGQRFYDQDSKLIELPMVFLPL